jgi:CBS domain-containing protein
MRTVREIISYKGNEVYTVSPTTSVFNALQIMAEKNIGALVVAEEGIIGGIISERDYARKVSLLGKDSRDTVVKEIMSSKIIYVDPAVHVDECMAIMIDKRIRHLPVIEEGKLAGLISIGDVVKAVIDEREFVIEQLVHYITGNPG